MKKKTNLSAVDMARFVKLRVVQTQDSCVQPIRGGNVVTCIIVLDNVGGRTVLARIPKADRLARCEVRASLVNKIGIECKKLVTRVPCQQWVNLGEATTYVETCCSREILSQISPSAIVYDREQPAANAAEIGDEVE